jgi:hypothetical protein
MSPIDLPSDSSRRRHAASHWQRADLVNKENETMALQATSKTRAPRGTKILTQAFFSAADNIPDAQRPAVIKAAVAAIRDELKEGRAKVKIAKAKAKGSTAKKPGPAPRMKTMAKTPRKMPALTKLGKPRAKPGPKPSVKPAPAPAV